MINSELNNSGTGMSTYHKQPPLAIKKIALRDVQNDNRSLLRSNQESLHFKEGRTFADATNACGSKRLRPECPSSPLCHPLLSNNGANEHLIHVRRRFELELGKGNIQDEQNKYADRPEPKHCSLMQQEIPQKQNRMEECNMHCIPVTATNHMGSVAIFSNGGPSVPNSHGKPVNGFPAAVSDCLKVTSEAANSVDSKTTDDQQRKERFIRLQKFLKQCDESNHRDCIQMLLHLSPAELSRNAIELEKRAIQLTIEEGKEMQRMKALKILEKSAQNNNPLQTTQQLQSKK